MPIIDTHAHLYFPNFAPDIDQVVSTCEAAGVTHQIQIGCDEISTLAAVEMAQKYPNFKAVIGLHPCDVDKLGVRDPEYHRYAGLETYQMQNKTLDQYFDWIEKLYLDHQDTVVGFGETGFDLYHRHTPELYNLQAESFKNHIELCLKYDKALVVHTRNAADETLEFFENNQVADLRAVIHAFSEGPEFATIMTEKYGFYLGIGGVATYPKMEAVREAIKTTPLEFLLTETDTPFLVPHLARKSGIKTNTPALLPEVIKLIAELKNIDLAECETQLFKNAQKCFGV